MSLFWRVFAINTGVLVVGALVLALSPASVSNRILVVEALVLTVGVVLVLAVNLLLLRRAFEPLERLTGLMRRVDPLDPGRRLEIHKPVAEVGHLVAAFNDLLDRLERERRDSARRALQAQEDERRRLARELHDEVGQTLTGVALQLDTLAGLVSGDLKPRVVALEESARAGVEEVREIARGLRPEALDDFGLRSALVTLGSAFAEQSGIRIVPALARDLPELDRDDELVVYRVAQESLTNVARHADATRADVILDAQDGAVVLRVRDDGCGIDPRAAASGAGVRGMRERALLVGGSLDITPLQPSGTEVRLALPVPVRR
jgi:two-component system sensor histidine kinase UhpB